MDPLAVDLEHFGHCQVCGFPFLVPVFTVLGGGLFIAVVVLGESLGRGRVSFRFCPSGLHRSHSHLLATFFALV